MGAAAGRMERRQDEVNGVRGLPGGEKLRISEMCTFVKSLFCWFAQKRNSVKWRTMYDCRAESSIHKAAPREVTLGCDVRMNGLQLTTSQKLVRERAREDDRVKHFKMQRWRLDGTGNEDLLCGRRS